MDWFAAIDAYCERGGPGLFAEPLNAASNAGFLLVSALATRAALRRNSGPAVLALALITGGIGFGSLAFHTFANRLSAIADVLPIAVFIYSYVAFALRRFAAWRWWAVTVALCVLMAVNAALPALVPRDALNGSTAYLPALAAGVLIAFLLRQQGHPAHKPLFAAAGVFTLSIVFRSLDEQLCSRLSFGTHFVWHLLNAVVLGLYLAAAIRLEHWTKK